MSNTRELRKGDRVKTTGHGRTRTCLPCTGTVIRKRGESVFVQWDHCTAAPDEMHAHEVERLPVPTYAAEYQGRPVRVTVPED